MAVVTLSLQKQDATGQTYANPAKPDFTVRFKNSSARKTLNGVSVNNLMCEIVYNDNNSVTVGGVAASDAISARLRVSGVLESKTRLNQFLTGLAAQIAAWQTQNVFQGFNPTTAPAITEP